MKYFTFALLGALGAAVMSVATASDYHGKKSYRSTQEQFIIAAEQLAELDEKFPGQQSTMHSSQ